MNTNLKILFFIMSYYPSQRRSSYPARRRRRSSFSGLKIRLAIAGVIILFSAISYMTSSTVNPVTGQNQRVAGMTTDQEIKVGRSAAYSMVEQHGGLSRDSRARKHVEMVGKRLENTLYHRLQKQGITNPYPFDFHLLGDPRVINAFALPGGQVFITEALYTKMTHEGQLAGVLGHEIGHVIERHGAERMAHGKLLQRIAGAAGVAGGDISTAQMASTALNVVSMGYGRKAELESDRWGVELMVWAGYDPEHMLAVMDILEEANNGGAPPEFMSSHPKPANRKEYIREVISEQFPNGLPPGLR